MSRKVSSLGVALGSFAAGILLASAANAVEPSGTAIRVDPAVNASGTGGDRLLELQGAVFMGDQIVASPNGLAQIKFVDDTRLVIGPNSRLKVDEFVFSPNNTAQKVTISALRGTFRFITGKSPHDAYEIRTPTMTIAVRGSIVEINVNSRDSSFRFREGSGVACDHSNNCIVADNACRIWYTPYNGTIGQATGVDLQRRLDVEYGLFKSEVRFASDFRATGGCGVADNRVFGTPPESSGSKEEKRTRPTPEPHCCQGGGGDDEDDNENNDDGNGDVLD